MGISLKTHKMLWGRAASRCAFPDCCYELVMDASETDDASLVGEECHIVARELSGPRGKSPLAEERRDKYDNLILLCNVHHKLIDDQPLTYTIEILKKMKSDHEQWVSKSLQGFDSVRQRDEELYATYIEQWVQFTELDQWSAWTSFLLSDPYELHIDIAKNLSDLGNWTLSRLWPKRYPELKAALVNFQLVLQDLLSTFHIYAEKRASRYRLVKFYKDARKSDVYEELYKKYELHVELIKDLVLELTRAANYVSDLTRKCIDPTFRINEGAILVEHGPLISLKTELIRTEYSEDERTLYPYPGLEQFKVDRTKRDVHFGL